jgi:hypothetical protein
MIERIVTEQGVIFKLDIRLFIFSKHTSKRMDRMTVSREEFEGMSARQYHP